jgi:hypothetical protein
MSYNLAAIKATTQFADLLALGLVYAATELQEKEYTIMFVKNGIRYMVYANGYVRRGVFDEYMNKYLLNPIGYTNYQKPKICFTLAEYQGRMQVLIDYLRRNNL